MNKNGYAIKRCLVIQTNNFLSKQINQNAYTHCLHWRILWPILQNIFFVLFGVWTIRHSSHFYSIFFGFYLPFLSVFWIFLMQLFQTKIIVCISFAIWQKILCEFMFSVLACVGFDCYCYCCCCCLLSVLFYHALMHIPSSPNQKLKLKHTHTHTERASFIFTVTISSRALAPTCAHI